MLLTRFASFSFNSLDKLRAWASYNIVPCSQDNFFPIVFNLRLGHSDLVLLGLTERR